MWQSIKKWWNKVKDSFKHAPTTPPSTPSDPSSVRPVIGKDFVTGYGPVNMYWKLPHSVILNILTRMQTANVRMFVVEGLGHAGEDLLGFAAKMTEAKEKLKYIAYECSKRGLWFNIIVANDNAGDGAYSNGGVKLEKREPQCRAWIDWLAAQYWKDVVIPTIMAEPQTAAGKRLEAYAAQKFKAAGFRIMHNQGDRPQANATIGGVRTDFYCYHNASLIDWPKSKAAIVLSDTGAAIRALNVGGKLDGRGNPDAIRKWVAAGKARGQAAVCFYGFNVAEYDEAAIDAMSAGVAATSTTQDEPASGEADIPAGTKFLHADIRDWPVTSTLNASIGGGQIRFPHDKADVWPVATSGTGKDTNANVWAVVKIGGQWYAGTWEWCRKGQTSKPMSVLAKTNGKGDHFKVKPLSSWTPASGERFGIMVSGHARAAGRNVKERTNVSWVAWP